MKDISFMSWGNCAGLDASLMFPETTKGIEDAKKVCQDCIVRERCLEYALTPPFEKWGVWGQTSERERRFMRNRRRRAS